MKKSFLVSILLTIFLPISVAYSNVNINGNIEINGTSEIGAFKPNQIEGCKLWLDANDKNTLSFRSGTNFIVQWNDKSESKNDLNCPIENSQPSYGLTQLNGIDVISFDGIDDFLRKFETNLSTGYRAYSVIIVIKPKRDTLFDVYMDIGSTDLALIMRANTTSIGVKGGISIAEYGYNGAGCNNSYLNVWHIFTGITNGLETDTYKSWVNGNFQRTVETGATNITTKYIHIGVSAIGFNDAYFDLAEIIIYDKVLTDYERQEVEKYLSEKWSI